ncbi:MAG: leucyl/phenylalanyl-tRNA--protein transferase [Spirochaetia bacterium]
MPSEKRGSSEPQRGSSEPQRGSREPADELTTRFRFPHARSSDADGFLAVGGDLKPGTLLLAYGNGIFPWTTHPITWWSPDPRAIIPIGGLHVSHSLRKVLRSSPFSVSFDRAFRRVMEGCAAPRPHRKETWISRQFITAYTRLHELGRAHSVEVWREEHLVGGLYGVSIGGFFAGESMYSEEENASKVALVAMEKKLRECRYILFDVQMMTPHLRSMGAVEIPRSEYLQRLRQAVDTKTQFAPDPLSARAPRYLAR